MEFLSQTYVALRGPTGVPQTASDTIGRLSDRLSPSTLLADRRAAVLALKGLVRDCKEEVGERSLNGLLEVLYNDAEVDADIGKAVLETLNTLCDASEENGGKEAGFKHTDIVLANEKTIHTLFALLADTNFYTRLATLQYLSTLLANRRQAVQSYFLTARTGATNTIAVLEDKREIIRNEAITVIQSLISQSPDIQKVLAFEGAFEKLFNIVTQEGGVDGGIVAQEALTCVDALLRFNTSNQSYFQETTMPQLLSSLLLFPYEISFEDVAPQEFALQFWDAQKMGNASCVVAILGMLISPKGTSAQDNSFIRCLVEIALASNAPTPLKTQALRLLPPSLNFPLSSLVLTPYMPVPDTNGEEWDRMEPASALDTLVEVALHGEYNSIMDGTKRTKDGMELRAAATTVFENFVRKDELRHAIVEAMIPPEGGSPADLPVTPLLISMTSPPAPEGLDPATVVSTQLATHLFAHLVRSSPRAKSVACSITPNLGGAAQNSSDAGNFFVPADGPAPAAEPEPVAEEPEEDEPQTLLQILSENLSLALLSRSRSSSNPTSAAIRDTQKEAREYDRLIVAYLCLLSQWLWEHPTSVREFLESGGMGVLVDPINHLASEVDSLVPSLCAFLLGICYEFNREPGEITRATIYPILSRLGVDTLSARLTRLREDERFKAVAGPDSTVLLYPAPASQFGLGFGLAAKPESEVSGGDEAEIWFDWAFLDFWKSNYYTIQRGFAMEPDQVSSASGQNAETAMLVTSLRDVIRKQSEEMETLRKQLRQEQSKAKHEGPSAAITGEIAKLKSDLSSLSAQLQRSEQDRNAVAEQLKRQQEEVSNLSAELQQSDEKRKEVEKEQEDLLVLLDEVTVKRKKDKDRMRGAGLEVSEDEAEDDDGDED